MAMIEQINSIYSQNTQLQQKTSLRVVGNLVKIFQINALDNEDCYETKQMDFLLNSCKKLSGFINNDVLLGLAEYKGYHLVINFVYIAKENQLIEGRKYFFYGEMTMINEVLMMIPSICSLCENDLDLYIYEKTIELIKRATY